MLPDHIIIQPVSPGFGQMWPNDCIQWYDRLHGYVAIANGISTLQGREMCLVLRVGTAGGSGGVIVGIGRD